MIKITLLSVGKTHEPWLEEGLKMYVARMRPMAEFQFVWLKDNRALERILEREFEKHKTYVVLDSGGKSFDSVAFSEWFFDAIEKAHSRLTFVIGPAEGLSDAIKKSAFCMSFSKLTFTHQLVRLVLLEQIFRAFEIRKGSKYHK